MMSKEDLQAKLATVSIKFTNDKGNVCVSARNQLRKQLNNYLPKAFEYFADVLIPTKEGVSFPISRDSTTGDIVYVHVSCTINTKEPVAIEK